LKNNKSLTDNLQFNPLDILIFVHSKTQNKMEQINFKQFVAILMASLLVLVATLFLPFILKNSSSETAAQLTITISLLSLLVFL